MGGSVVGVVVTLFSGAYFPLNVTSACPWLLLEQPVSARPATSRAAAVAARWCGMYPPDVVVGSMPGVAG
jgi:hypothetical protein